MQKLSTNDFAWSLAFNDGHRSIMRMYKQINRESLFACPCLDPLHVRLESGTSGNAGHE